MVYQHNYVHSRSKYFFRSNPINKEEEAYNLRRKNTFKYYPVRKILLRDPHIAIKNRIYAHLQYVNPWIIRNKDDIFNYYFCT